MIRGEAEQVSFTSYRSSEIKWRVLDCDTSAHTCLWRQWDRNVGWHWQKCFPSHSPVHIIRLQQGQLYLQGLHRWCKLL